MEPHRSGLRVMPNPSPTQGAESDAPNTRQSDQCSRCDEARALERRTVICRANKLRAAAGPLRGQAWRWNLERFHEHSYVTGLKTSPVVSRRRTTVSVSVFDVWSQTIRERPMQRRDLNAPDAPLPSPRTHRRSKSRALRAPSILAARSARGWMARSPATSSSRVALLGKNLKRSSRLLA
jgi:ribosomal protein S14